MSRVDVGQWADTLIGRYAGHDVIGNALFPITRSSDPSAPLEIEMHPLDCHPVDFLPTFRTPPSCIALGLVSAGWAAPMGSQVRPSMHPDAQCRSPGAWDHREVSFARSMGPPRRQ